MKQFFFATACLAALAISAASASAQGPVQGIVTGNCGKPGGCGAPAVSDNIFSRLAWWKSSSCSTCGHHATLHSWTNNAAGVPVGGHHAKAPAYNPYPNGVPGTLVFPNHQYIRSPRDFFMVDAK